MTSKNQNATCAVMQSTTGFGSNLKRNGLAYDSLECPCESFILLGRADGHADAVTYAPRYQRTNQDALGLHASGKTIGVLRDFEVDEVGAGGYGAKAKFSETIHQPFGPDRIVLQSPAHVSVVAQRRQPSGFRHDRYGKRIAEASKALQHLGVTTGVTQTQAGQTVSLRKSAQHDYVGTAGAHVVHGPGVNDSPFF